MTIEQLKQVARAGFPERVKKHIDFKNSRMIHHSGVYRLYHKDTEFMLVLPKEDYISVHIGEDGFCQIQTGHRAFDHHAAIMEMKRMNLI